MLHTKFRGNRPAGSKENFLRFLPYEPVRDKTNKLDQNRDFCVLLFYDRMGNTLQIGA